MYQGESGRVGVSHGRPWLPRRGATALGGRATKLMGDVIIFLLSERHTDRQTNRRNRDREEGKEERKRRWKADRKSEKKKSSLVMASWVQGCNPACGHQVSVFTHL